MTGAPSRTQMHACKDLAGVDAVKFVMAIWVIAIHLVNFDGCGIGPGKMYWFVWLTQAAVPFFFTVSGFLTGMHLAGKSRVEKSEAYRRGARKTLRLYGVWLLIYLPLSVDYYCREQFGILESIAKYIGGIVLRGQTVMAWQLWYLYALLLTQLVLSFCMRRGIRLYVPLLFFAAVTAAAHYTAPLEIRPLQSVLMYPLGGGLPFCLGLCLYRWHRRLPGYYASAAALVAASYLLYSTGLPYWNILGGIAATLVALALPLRGNAFSMYLRRQSMWIYYLHMYVIFLLFTPAAITPAGFVPGMIIIFSATFIISALVIYCASKLKKRAE